MSYAYRLGISAITAIFLIGAMVAYLSRTGNTGMFAEENRDCTTINGGVRSYRYCGPDVEVVRQEIGFRQSRPHLNLVPSDKQRHIPFDAIGDERYHRLRATWPHQRQSRLVASESLNEEPFSQERYASRASLLDDPYESTPWAKG